ncbi:hypothetical protein AMAG_15485 [Allomyces macrogynus ATCC 38327]|uniref:Sugar phosphate transporter domain-containing protein n=1 Tax=Allomyces macrogynus (strain ATCC 38327) TaxID=578462 RepID=A0A0L0T840_ALLM3|nr:hypothetical protein AMAG_15485 [Allomyces macrogynus ATCC 38327]|eukprot:KNE70734.1 hypothetical protein AMAG_15485 [Allomyces macrogynus ATCC 38327]
MARFAIAVVLDLAAVIHYSSTTPTPTAAHHHQHTRPYLLKDSPTMDSRHDLPHDAHGEVDKRLLLPVTNPPSARGPRGPPCPTHSRTEATVFILANILCSVSIVLANTRVLRVFPYPVLLTFSHQATCWLTTRFMISRGWLTLPRSVPPSREAAAVGTASVFGLFLMNASLTLNSVGVYQLTKLACLPAIVVLQTVAYGAVVPAPRVLATLAVIVLGVAAATQSEYAAKPAGCVAGALAVIATAWFQVSLQHRASFKGVKGMASVAVLSPWATLVLAGLVVMVEILPRGIAWSNAPWTWIIVSSLMAVATNYVGNSLVQKTSAVTYNVVGHAKTLLIVAAGVVVDPSAESWDAVRVSGMVMSVLGMAAYAAVK